MTFCTVRYGKDKLKRKLEETWKNVGEHPAIPTKVTRRSFTAANFTASCFFCDKDTELIPCRTENLNKHVQSWATYLFGEKLLGKLSEGDMIATEAMSHKKCLTKLYNQFKSKKREEQSEPEILKTIERKAHSDIVNYEKETMRSCHESNSAPIFTQKSLADIYSAKLVYHGASKEFTKKTHCTHLRKKIMMEVPGLCDARDGRQVTLSIDDDDGRALFEACESSAEDET